MSLDLVNAGTLRVTQETDCVIEAEHRATGKDKSEIVREVLQAWANKKIHEASLLNGLLKSRGSSVNDGEVG
jgi:acetylglutamate kinase